ncbi:hypothetical protein GZ77_12115 [Endozoicomonas montiporae]|uniref:Uncharacterized protein n=2 Tax=Endozoicomonas montiporae TaxID=1027273 RepID=A0A081N953_9GAMM|nr:hypothetical protein [Endozoicomonas montiporae]KEQ14976.1 hypothetical protein GZ77_12115 [Endozoicomonas montiporae]
MSVTAAHAAPTAHADQVPPQFMMRFRQQVQEKTRVLNLSEDKQKQLMELKKNLYRQQQAANKEFPDDRNARNAARRANRNNYNDALNKMLSRKQRRDMQEWRASQRKDRA